MSGKSRQAIITGASSGIGEATARRFASEGWSLGLSALGDARLDVVLHEIGRVDFAVSGDLREPATAEALRRNALEAWGEIDAIVHCAGAMSAADAITAPLEQWRRPFDSMIDSAVLLVRALAPLMSENGRIILITSIHGERTESKSSSYAMAKAALNQYCRSLAVELADRSILVNAIAPGFVRTPMSVVDGVDELESEWFRINYIEGHHLPLKRPARPEEIAGVAWFLAGADSSYMTGQVITVDGGLTITF